MPTKYKLTYFDVTGAAEHIRYIFAYANQEYEDVRIQKEQWPALKPNTPFGKLPILEIDGKQIAQSNAIARYLARKFGLTGKDEWESLQCDVIVDTAKDFMEGIYKMFYEADAQKKIEMKKQFAEKDLPFYLGKFNKIAADNAAGLLVGTQVTWADITMAVHLGMLQKDNPDILKPYPALANLLKKINSNPGVKSWLEKRPTNDPYNFKLC